MSPYRSLLSILDSYDASELGLDFTATVSYILNSFTLTLLVCVYMVYMLLLYISSLLIYTPAHIIYTYTYRSYIHPLIYTPIYTPIQVDQLGHTSTIDLIPNGSNIDVNNTNATQYLIAQLKFRLLDRVKTQLIEIMSGM